MPITDFLERNARQYPDDVCLVEINPEIKEDRRVTWKEFELIEPSPKTSYRREITWSVFDEKANRFAHLLLQRGIKKGDKVAILMMNGLEWLPIYFGILKTGALAVPLNFRYSADEIEYCVNLAEVDVLVMITIPWLPTVPASLYMQISPMRMTRRFISLPEPQVSRRQFYINTEVWYMPVW